MVSKVTVLTLLLALILYKIQSHSPTEEILSSRATVTTPNGALPIRPAPVKVFLLVGQSNMEGHGYIDVTNEDGEYRNGTLEWMVQVDPQKYGKLKNSTFSSSASSSDNNHWTVRSDTWITFNKQHFDNVRVEMNQYGPLSPGYGGGPGEYQMGPELGFGWTMAESLNNHKSSQQQQQILLIKVAWGGKSLAVDFRPPSSGGITGLYYESVIANTYKTLSRLDELFPGYADTYGRYELAGMAWHQGWNDGCDYNMTAEYEYNLANLIRDVRIDLDAPDLPVTIGVSGMGGYNNPDPRRDAIIAAQFAVANSTKYPEFEGTVMSVETRPFLRPPLPDSPGNQGYHWNNNCETYWLIGQAMGKAMVDLLSRKRRQDPNIVAIQ